MLRRIAIYLKEMFPINYYVGSLIYTLVVVLTFSKLSNIAFEFKIQYLLIGTGLSCLILLIRIMDEFKDYEDDLKNFPDRALPSGRVEKSDLFILGSVTVGIGALCSMVSIASFNLYLFSLAYSYLMLKWFFVESKMRKSLPLALISHHPIVFIYLFYIGETFRSLSNQNLSISMYWIIIPIGLASTNWEFSRKLRSPSEETEYTTYSKIWGPRTATFVTLITQFIIIAGLNYFFSLTKVSSNFIILANLIFFISMLPYFKFLATLKHNKNMKVYAEKISITLQILLLIAYFI